MAQSGFTPISLYFSATPSAVPTAPNLVAGELALNTNDGKLYYKNSSGVVTLLAGSTSGPAGGSTTQVQYNNAGVLAGITGATTNGTALTLVAPVLGTPASATLTLATGLPISTGVSGLGTNVATALGVNVGTAGAFVVNGGALGSPSSVGTMPAFTLGGTVSGGGNQINNVVIGTTTPLAGAFTSLTASTTLGVTGVSTLTGGAVVQGLTVGLGAGAVATNTAVGVSALAGNSTGARVTAVGALAGIVNTASDNAFFGYNTGASNTSGARNTALGSQALANNVSGTDNTAVGYTALLINTGSNNTAVGGGPYPYAPLSNNNSGSANTAIGTSALAQNTSASNNTAVGYQAAYTGTTATQVVAIGSGALKVNTVDYGTAVGFNALTANTTGAANAAFGAYALSTNTIGEGNSAFGALGFGLSDSALQANLSGSYNSAFGLGALAKNTTASNNTAVGYQAGYTNNTGAKNTYLGAFAGYTSNAAADAFNVCVGYATGYALTTATYNSFFGQNAGAAINSGSKNTIIGRYDGNQGGLDIRTASNYIVLSDGDGNPLVSTADNQTVALEGAVPNSGTGITFPATQSASSDANTLDDYEEGTFTPTLTPGTSGTITLSATIDTISYVKIGKQVTLFGRINIASVSSPTGTIGFALPFAADNTLTEESDFYALSNFTHGVNIGATTVSLFSEITPTNNTLAVVFEMIDAANWSALPASNLLGNGNEYFYFTGSYRASS